MAGRTATRPCQRRIAPHAAGCKVDPRFRTKTDAKGVGVLENRGRTTICSKAEDMTKRFHAMEIRAATSQGTFIARRSFTRVLNCCMAKQLRLFDPASGALWRLPRLECKVIVAKVVATVDTRAVTRIHERDSGGQNLCCDILPEMQLREITRLAGTGALLFSDVTSSDAYITLPVRRLFVMLSLVA
jgi:hypothetical protein